MDDLANAVAKSSGAAFLQRVEALKQRHGGGVDDFEPARLDFVPYQWACYHVGGQTTGGQMAAHAVTLRLPAPLYDRFSSRAERAQRSLEAELLEAVATIARRKRKNPLATWPKQWRLLSF